MVVAFIVPGLFGDWVLKKITGEGVIETVATGTEEFLREKAKEEGLELWDEIKDFVSNIDWEGIGEAVGTAASAVIKSTGEVTSGIAKEIVPDLIESIERGYDVIRTKLSGAEASVISAFVVGFLVIFTMIYLFYEIRRGK